MSSLILTIDASPDIVMSASPGATDLGIVSFSEPAILRLNDYAPSVPWLDGETALSFRRPQTLLNWTFAPFGAASEAEADTLIAALDAAVSRLGYNVTRNKNGVSKVYRCDAGSVTPTGEVTRITLDRPSVAVWNVSIPCSPVLVS